MTTLDDTPRDLLIERDLPQLLQTIVERASELLEATGGCLYLCEPEQRQVRCAVSYNTPQDYTGKVLKYGEGAAGMVAETGETLVIDDYRTWEQRAATYEDDQPFISVLSVPMRRKDGVIGVLHMLDNTKVGAFDAQDLRILMLFADQAEIAIENSNLLVEMRRRADEFAALYEVTRDLVAQRDLHSLLEMIVERATTLLNAPTGTIFLYDENRNNLEIVVAKGFNLPNGTRMGMDEGMAGLVARTRQPMIVDNYNAWKYRSPKYSQVEMTASIEAPMLYGDKLIGVLDVSELKITTHKFSESDLRLLTMFANQAAMAIENAHLFESEEQRRMEAAAIADVGRDISASLQLDVVLERIAWHAKELLNSETSAVYLAVPASPIMRAIAAFGPDSEEIKDDPLTIGEGILGDIALQKKGEIVNDSLSDSRSILIKGTEDIQDEHIMGMPILLKDRFSGLIAVWRTGAGQDFTPQDLEFLNSLAQQASIAIENASLFTAERNRRQEAETLRDAAQKITSTLDQEQAIQFTLDQLAKVVPFESASVQLLGEGYLEIIGGRGWPDPASVLGIRFPIPGDNPNTQVVLERKPVILEDVRAGYLGFNTHPHELIRSWLGVPLIVRDQVIGMFAVDHSQPYFFTEVDAQMVNALAGQAAIAIENARLYEETRRRLAELEILQTIAARLRIAQTLGDVFPIVLDQLIELLGFGSALVELLDSSSGEIVSVEAHGVWAPITGMRTPGDIGVSSRVIASGEPYITTDVVGDGLIAHPELVAGINAVACVPIVAQHQPIGTLWVGRQSNTAITAEEVNLLAALGEMVGNTIQRMRLHEQTVRQAEEISLAYDLTLEGWAKALELRDKETEGHSRRVTALTMQISAKFSIPQDELTHIRRGVLLHDIGKMGVPDQILKKTGLLNDEEWAEMRKHPQYAYDLIYPINYLRPALDIPYSHHEKWDGSGYPRGLKGEQIPLSARIFAVVDVYDALSCDRPYRAAWPRTDVINYIIDQAGKHFDPQVVDAFLECIQA